VGKRIERKRQRLMGRNKGSFTETANKATVTTTTLIRRLHNMNSRRH